MKVLVDTHALLWFVAGDPRLSRKARSLLESTKTEPHVSIASWWEIAIKCSLGRLMLDDPLEEFMAQRIREGFRILHLEPRHLPGLVNLPFHHRDPFDRLIVSQAVSERMTVCTADAAFKKYGVQLIW